MKSVTELFLKNTNATYQIETNQKKYPLVEVIKKEARKYKTKNIKVEAPKIEENKEKKMQKHFKEGTVQKRIQKKGVKHNTKGRILLNKWLLENKTSDSTLADVINISRYQVTDWANGTTIPSNKMKEALSVICEIDESEWKEEGKKTNPKDERVKETYLESFMREEEAEKEKPYDSENFINDRIYTVKNQDGSLSCENCDIFYLGSLKKDCNEYMKAITGIDCTLDCTVFKIKKKIQPCTPENIKAGQFVTMNPKSGIQYEVILVLTIDGTYNNKMILREKGQEDFIDKIEYYCTLV